MITVSDFDSVLLPELDCAEFVVPPNKNAQKP
jgi:hypothetical protein